MDRNDVAKTFGDNLKRIRIAKGVSRKDLAKAIGVTEIAFGSYERGERNPTAEKIFALAKNLDVTANDLFGESENIKEQTIFEYRLQRAFKLANDADLNPREFDGKIFLSVVRKLNIKDKDSGISYLEDVPYTFAVSNNDFVELIEKAESRAIQMDITFSESFKYLNNIENY